MALLPLRSAWAQQFEVAVTCDRALPVRLTLALYVDDSLPVVLSPSQLSTKEVDFAGRLSAPLYAELRSPQLPNPVGFYLESTSVQIVVDAEHPDRSKVTGSRINSLYRYALEQAADDTAALGALLLKQPAEIYNASLIADLLPRLDATQALTYFERLEGDARKGYPYRRLKAQLRALASTMSGSRMPDFLFADDKGRQLHYDSVRVDSTATVILVGATWCEQCSRIEEQLERLQQQRPIKVLAIHLDRQKQGWDAPFLQQLSVDHIPYLILLDDHGVIHQRDLRGWQLERALTEMGVAPNKE